MFRTVLLIFSLFLVAAPAISQDSLPKISVKNKSGKVILSWNNPYRDVVLINIQRSPDSLKGFKTILTVADPTAITNGYLDHKTPNTNQYYRLYVQQSGGLYFFTASYRPVLDTVKAKPAIAKAAKKPEAPVEIKDAPVVTEVVESPQVEGQLKTAKNTVTRKKLSNTKSVGVGEVEADAPDAQEFNAPSVHVYTNPQGQVVMALPPEKTSQYTLKFYKDDGTPLFTMNKVRDSQLTLDKSNFIRSGWFRFELYENSIMKEKNRFFIPKENF